MKSVSIFILIFYTSRIIAQNHSYKGEEYYFYHGDLETYVSEITEYKDLPAPIDSLLFGILNAQLGDNFNKTAFKKGIVVNLEKYFKDNPKNLNRSDCFLPNYIINYVFIDSTVGIDYYEFLLELDKYGQIISLGFPHKNKFNSYDIMSLDQAIDISDSIVTKEKFEYDFQYYYISYDSLKNELIWNINYSKTQNADDNLDITYYLDFTFSTKKFELLELKYDTIKQTETESPIDEEMIPIIKTNAK